MEEELIWIPFNLKIFRFFMIEQFRTMLYVLHHNIISYAIFHLFSIPFFPLLNDQSIVFDCHKKERKLLKSGFQSINLSFPFHFLFFYILFLMSSSSTSSLVWCFLHIFWSIRTMCFSINFGYLDSCSADSFIIGYTHRKNLKFQNLK